MSGPEKGVIAKGVFSLEVPLESLQPLAGRTIRIFFLFFLLGGGEGALRGAGKGGGGSVFIENRRRAGGFPALSIKISYFRIWAFFWNLD